MPWIRKEIFTRERERCASMDSKRGWKKRGGKKVSFTRKKKKKKNTMNGKLEKLLSIRIITFGTFMVITDGPFSPLLYIFSTFTFKVLPVKRNLHKKEIVSPVLKGALCYFTLYAALFYSFQNLHSPTLFSPRLWTININVNAARWKWILSFVDRVSLVPLF